MKKFITLCLFISLFSITTTFSQKENYTSLLIPSALKEDANAVVRDNSLEITIEDVDAMTVFKKEVITVLNKLGDNYVSMSAHYDDDTKITELSATIYDAFGSEIKKYKERDFLDVSAVSGGTLYSDSRVKYVDYTPISYPYTVVFESEYKTSSTGFIPSWFPVESYFLSIEKSSYKLLNPKHFTIRKKEKNFHSYSIENTSTAFNVNYAIKNQKVVKYENNAPLSIDIMPHLLVGVNQFALKKIVGEATNWSEFGKWRYDYLKNGNDELSEAIKAKVRLLVEGVTEPIEKAKIVYAFMQNKTRYISVQEGVGGWMPIPANEVDKVGYGDCKGLTNYTKTLLDAVGVKSHYAVIWAGADQRDVEKDFFGMQGNHVILNIPNNGNDIWLECTSQTIPFGFLGDFTDDRNVLVMTPEGGIIKRTPAYKDETNLQEIKATIQLEKNGSLSASLNRVSNGIKYDDKSHYERFTEEELVKNYKSNVWDYNNNLEITDVDLLNDKEKVVFKEDLKMTVKSYASVNEQEYLFRVNVFNKNSFVPKRYRSRKLPLKISRGYKDDTRYEFKLPEGYVLSSLPSEKVLSTKFGAYKVTFTKIDDTTFTYHKSMVIKAGVYLKEDYSEYRNFRKSIAKYEKLRIAITQK
ncbi:DUF3857 domain-containing protein [Polaribacter sejongensis]|uniref:DUF3857 domain-containing protein n=1 Tax=Polaribacter sejongensis TaxID=985043 RepID=A0ABN5F4Q0_9FLAO|nr:DUF3857 domain-containing protein [Polaribacter sejongensis]AUC21132.1 DUF3857 domain-containing protein [Polaribacter sejongensis]